MGNHVRLLNGQAVARKICIIFFFFIFSTPLFSTTDFERYYFELLSQLNEKKLAQHPYWLRLGHYKKTILGSYKSEADGSMFFMSPVGRVNPSLEIQSTLYGFFFGDVRHPREQHPQCRFPERFAWLSKELNFDFTRMPRNPCEQYLQWRNDVKIESLTFVFASYYINNPSSMFGHTFLKLNRSGSSSKRQLIDYGLNFAANPTTTNPLVYAFKGLTGGFQGLYALFPYYFKVNEYNDLESRDIWEYKLNLTPDEVERTMRHIWELGSTWFDYFYIDENCSYQLLTLLEVTKPDTFLSNKYFYIVQPVDTVKQIVAIKNLTEPPKYRPSLFNKYMAYYNRLNRDEKKEFHRIEKSKTLPSRQLSTTSRAAIIDTALEAYNFRYYGEMNTPQTERQFIDQLLLKRANLGHVPQAKPTYDDDSIPTQGHESTTLKLSALGGGLGPGMGLLFRPTLHELVDPYKGYSPLSQVIMLDMAARWYLKSRAVPYFDYLNLVDIISLSYLQKSYLRPSWGVRFGFQSLQEENYLNVPNDRSTFYTEVGGGLTFSIFDSVAWFVMLAPRIETSPALNNWARFAPVATSGLLARFWIASLLIRSDYRHYVFTQDEPLWLNKATLNIGLNHNFSSEITASLNYKKDDIAWRRIEEYSLAVKVYL